MFAVQRTGRWRLRAAALVAAVAVAMAVLTGCAGSGVGPSCALTPSLQAHAGQVLGEVEASCLVAPKAHVLTDVAVQQRGEGHLPQP